jgi:hypothetical protein
MCIYFNSHKKNWEARGTLWDFAQAENSNVLGHGSPTSPPAPPPKGLHQLLSYCQLVPGQHVER